MRILRFLSSSAAFAALLGAQQLVLPDNHHLCESPVQLGSSGSTEWWRTTAGRFQVIYEASHFLGKSGVTGPILITALRFRGEDGEPNLGGQVYAGVTIELGSTTLTNGTMSTTFAANRAPATPNATTMGALGTTAVTVLPSVGSTPNNWFIDIDLLAIGAAFSFDPTGAQPNLLVDITMPTAPSNAAPLALLETQDTTGGATIVRGRGVTTPLPTAVAGGSSAAPPVIGLAFTGGGGTATLHAASNERYGAACGGSASTFYQSFANGQAFDLGSGITLTPDNAAAPNYYTVAAGAPPVDVTQINAAPNTTIDDDVITHPLGFTFNYPGGSTTTIKPCTNGFVWLDGTMTDVDWIPTRAKLLGTTANLTARLLPFWFDLAAARNAATHPNCGLHVKTDTSGGVGNAVCYVTWYQTGLYRTPNAVGVGGHAVLTFQCVLRQTGAVEFRYGSMPAFVGNQASLADMVPALVGFTRGRIGGVGSVDPQSRDLSMEVPFATGLEGTRGHVGQTVTATPDPGGIEHGGRCFGGQVLTFGATNVPPGAILAVQALDVGATRPGLQTPTIVAPGCMVSTTTSPTIWEVFVMPGSTVVGTVPGVVPHGYEGTDMYAQFFVLDGLLNGGPLVTVASDAIKHHFGRD